MDEFMREIEAYAAACGVQPSTVVQNAGGGSGVAWARWKAGGSCSMRTADRIRAFMAKNPPPSATDEAAA